MHYEVPTIMDMGLAVTAVQNQKQGMGGDALSDTSPAYQDWE